MMVLSSPIPISKQHSIEKILRRDHFKFSLSLSLIHDEGQPVNGLIKISGHNLISLVIWMDGITH